jgi:hypothetical protein
MSDMDLQAILTVNSKVGLKGIIKAWDRDAGRIVIVFEDGSEMIAQDFFFTKKA